MNGNALSFLLRTKLKNQLVGFFKKPIRLVYVVVFIGLIVVTMIGGNEGSQDADRVIRSFSELTAILNALLIVIFATTFYAGLGNGGSVFKMADVNFLFPSPLNKRNILFYALIQQIGASMLIGIFILFQYTTLKINYDLSILGLLLIFIVYSLTVFLSQVLAMFIYTYTSDSDKKKNIAKTVFIALLIALAVYVGLHVLQNKNDIFKALAEAGNSLPVCIFPFAGWLGAFGGNLLMGKYLEAALWLGLSIVAFAAILIAMSKSKRDYYEDVLASAENTQNAVSAAKDGVAPEITPRVIKVGKTGIGKGEGATVFFHKHMLENRRASKIWIKPMSLMFAIMTIIFSLFMKGEGLIPIFAFSAYIQIFSVALGRFNRELTKPYIYLIPESPFKKLIYALAETLPTELLESVLIFVPVSIIVGADPISCVFCIIGRISFSVLFIASNLAIERIWGGSLSKLAGILIYMLIDILLAAPGIVLAIVLGANNVMIITPLATTVLSMAILNICVAALVLMLCRNVLQNAET